MRGTVMSRRLLGRALLSCAAIAVFAGCDDPAEPGTPNGFRSVNDTWAGQVVITRDTDASYWPKDQVTIQGFVIKGDSLELAVSYGGGCRDHAFLLLSDAAWMESYPVQVSVKLSHDAKGDNCKALVSRVLRFDLTPLKAAYNASYQTSSG